MRPKRKSSMSDKELTDLLWRTFDIPDSLRQGTYEVSFLENAVLLKDTQGKKYYFQRKVDKPSNENNQFTPEVSEKVLQLRKLLEPWKKKARNINKPV